ncbi:MAG: hypothetical protein ABI561_17295, partial [Bradyrhizobium sp.]
RQLDASTGASDPHDFAVRNSSARLSRHRVHRIPSRAFDDRETPSEWNGTTAVIMLIWDESQTNFGISEFACAPLTEYPAVASMPNGGVDLRRRRSLYP